MKIFGNKVGSFLVECVDTVIKRVTYGKVYDGVNFIAFLLFRSFSEYDIEPNVSKL